MINNPKLLNPKPQNENPPSNSRILIPQKKRSQCTKNAMDEIHAWHKQIIDSAFYTGHDNPCSKIIAEVISFLPAEMKI